VVFIPPYGGMVEIGLFIMAALCNRADHYISALKGKKVKVGFLYSAAYTANQNSALHNLGSGS